MAHLVGDEHAHLVVVEQLDRGGMQDDERLVDAVRAGVHERGLRHVELRHLGPVEGGADLGVQCPEAGILLGPDPDGIALEQQADATLAAEHGEDLLDHFLRAGNAAQGLERRAIGGVLPGRRRCRGRSGASGRREWTTTWRASIQG